MERRNKKKQELGEKKEQEQENKKVSVNVIQNKQYNKEAKNRPQPD